jgi:hypothetical protein
MSKRFVCLACLLGLTLLIVTPVAARTPDFHALAPGESVVFAQTVPINLVFIGYDAPDQGALLDTLPASYEPVVRFPIFYGLPAKPMGLHFDFTYHTVDADAAFEDRFFGYLASRGQPGPLTQFQQQYNDQQRNLLDITGPVLYIDAPATEKWLATHSKRALDIDIERGYTIYFINWYGRDDFQFHVYTKDDEVDPETGFNFGEREENRLNAWGGSSSRTWFYDLSAGPDFNTGNWNLDDDDLTGEGLPDYRIPPIWEYDEQGYREPARLFDDLALVTRYVGINLLFTSSTLFDPMVTAPGPGGDKIIHIEVLQDDPASDGRDTFDPAVIRRAFRSFQPYYDWKVKVEETNPIDPGAQRAFRIWTGLLEEDDCWNAHRGPFDELFCYFDSHRDDYVPSYDPNDYVGEVFFFNTTDANQGDLFGFLGFGVDNRVDGTQTYIFEIASPGTIAEGYGMSVVTIHEFGHHIGFSHPQAGYDSQRGLNYNPVNDFHYIRAGNASDSVMNALRSSNDFGRFDRDNMYRWEMAGYLNKANALLDDILAHPDAGRFEKQLQRADRYARRAQHDFERWQYLDAVRAAFRAYNLVGEVAVKLGID